jgi:hypothetical protein
MMGHAIHPGGAIYCATVIAVMAGAALTGHA